MSHNPVPKLSERPLSAFCHLLINSLDRLLAREPTAGPSIVYLEPSLACNLTCPACPTGTRQTDRPRVLLPLSHFQRIVNALQDSILTLYMYNWGEPFLNKDLTKMIQFATEKKIQTHLSSNLSFPMTAQSAEQLVASGLSSLKIGLDGFSTPVLSHYRRGANAELVRHNIILLSKAKASLNSDIKLSVVYHMFRHNAKEYKQTADFCRTIGIGFTANALVFTNNDENIYSYHPDLNWKTHQILALGSNGLSTKGCSWLYHALVVNPNLSISPCCGVTAQRNDFMLLDIDHLAIQLPNILQQPTFVEARNFISLFPSKKEFESFLANNLTKNKGMNLLDSESGSKQIACKQCALGIDVDRWKVLHREYFKALLNEMQASEMLIENRVGILYRLLILQIIEEVYTSPQVDNQKERIELFIEIANSIIARGTENDPYVAIIVKNYGSLYENFNIKASRILLNNFIGEAAKTGAVLQ